MELRVDAGTGEVTIVLGDLLQEGGLRRALHAGLPLRIHLVAELWKDEFFDDQRGRAEWRASILYDPLEETYSVQTGATDDEAVADARTFPSLEGARRELQRSFSLPLGPEEAGGYYYLGELEVETLSLSDLEELRRWLRGDLAPAVAGDEEVENAVEKGIRRLFIRLLGLPARRIRVRSPRFEYAPGGESRERAGDGEGETEREGSESEKPGERRAAEEPEVTPRGRPPAGPRPPRSARGPA